MKLLGKLNILGHQNPHLKCSEPFKRTDEAVKGAPNMRNGQDVDPATIRGSPENPQVTQHQVPSSDQIRRPTKPKGEGKDR
jgi:hypothetical protein